MGQAIDKRMIFMDQSGSYSQYYDCEFHSGPFIADRTGSKLLVGESNSESDKCDDGGVVLTKLHALLNQGTIPRYQKCL